MMPRILAVGVWWVCASALAQPVIEGYEDHAAFVRRVEKLDASPYVGVETLATTLGGRGVLLVTVGEGEVEKKPALLVIGSVHGPQLLGGELAVRIAERLAAEDEAASELRKRFTFYIVPRPTPDASEAFFQKPYVERAANGRPIDEDNDGVADEDGPEDLNGDGFITAMRVEDPAGEMMLHPDDARVLVTAERGKGERGVYKVYVEGIDNDKDEQFNEDGPGGTAFDRNFTAEYPYFKPGAGPHQVSETETRAVADFVWDHANIAAVVSFGVNDNIAQPWKANPQAEQQRIKASLLAEDAPYYDFIVESSKKIAEPKDAPASGDGEGSVVKWAYFHMGRWAFESRGWWVPKVEEKKEEVKKEEPAAAAPVEGEAQPPATAEVPPAAEKKEEPKKEPDKRAADVINPLKWFEQSGVAGFAPWVEVKHPDFPDKKVEVGGIKPFYLLNPPAEKLDGLAETHFKFIAELAGLMPKVTIGEVKVEPLGGSVYRVTVPFVNDGHLPTMTAMGAVNTTPYPLNVTLDLPEGARLLTGTVRSQLPPIPGNGRRESIWLVRTDAAELTITVTSPAVGSDTKKVSLK